MPLLKVSTIAPAATVVCAVGTMYRLVDSDSPGLVVKSAVARRQMDAESAKSPVRETLNNATLPAFSIRGISLLQFLSS